MMRKIAIIFALTCASVGAGNIVEEKCPSGDKKCSSKIGPDSQTLLQSRLIHEDIEDATDVEEDGGEDTEKAALVNEEEDDNEEEAYAMIRDIFDMRGIEETALPDEKEIDLYQDYDMEADNETEVASQEDDMEEIEDEAAETEDTADNEKIRRTGKGCAGIKLFGKCFKKAPNFNDVLGLAARKVSMPFRCSSLGDCANQAKRQIQNAAGGALTSMMRGGVKKAFDITMTVVKKTKTTLRQTRGTRDQIFNSFKEIANGMKNMAAAKENWGRLCAPNGVGLWRLVPTDCGAFNTIKDITKVRWNKLHRIPNMLGKLVGQLATCYAKVQFSFMRTPFFDIKVPQWCLPSAIQTPLEKVVGMFKYAVKAIASGTNDNSIFGQVVKKMGQVGSKFMKLFDEAISSRGFSLFEHCEQIADSMDSESNSTSHDEGRRDLFTDSRPGASGVKPSAQTKAKCKGSDFELFVAPGVGVKMPNVPIQPPAVSLKLSMGCARHAFFGDITLQIGASLWIAGFRKEITETEFGGGVVIGFNVGRPPRSFFSWDAAIAYAGEATVAEVTGDLAIKLKILPGPSPPKGFTISPKLKADDEPGLLQTKQDEIDAVVAEQETDEDKLVAGLAMVTDHFDEISDHPDFSDYAKTEHLMSALQVGATKMNEHRDAIDAPPITLKDISMSPFWS